MKKTLFALSLISYLSCDAQIVKVAYVSADTANYIDSIMTIKGYSCYFFKDTADKWLFPAESWMTTIAKYGGTIVNLPYSALKDKRPNPYKFTK